MADDPAASRQTYLDSMAAIRHGFLLGGESGTSAIRARADAADALARSLWQEAESGDERMLSGVSVMAVGGYGRQELFPASDLDLLFVVEDSAKEKLAKDAIRRMTQRLWDSEVRVAATTRCLSECERFVPENAEFTLSLLDARPLAGDAALTDKLVSHAIPKLLERERKAISARLLELTTERHARYGNTLFHLEPNIKECPGGLRDENTCGWLARLSQTPPTPTQEFADAFAFLAAIRCFLHFRAGRDVNALDWKTQDEAAAAGIGVAGSVPRDAANWMQLYFRHARVVARRLEQQTDALPQQKPLQRLRQSIFGRGTTDESGVRVQRGRIVLGDATDNYDPAHDPDVVLRAFQTVANSGTRLDHATEIRLEEGVPRALCAGGRRLGTVGQAAPHPAGPLRRAGAAVDARAGHS